MISDKYRADMRKGFEERLRKLVRKDGKVSFDGADLIDLIEDEISNFIEILMDNPAWGTKLLLEQMEEPIKSKHFYKLFPKRPAKIKKEKERDCRTCNHGGVYHYEPCGHCWLKPDGSGDMTHYNVMT